MTDLRQRLRAVRNVLAEASTQFHTAWIKHRHRAVGYALDDARKKMPDPDALADVVERYARHEHGCRSMNSVVGDCNCGYAEAIAKAKGEA